MLGGPWEDEWRRWARATVGEPDAELAAEAALRALRAGAGAVAAARGDQDPLRRLDLGSRPPELLNLGGAGPPRG